MLKRVSLVLGVIILSSLMFACSNEWDEHIEEGDELFELEEYELAIDEYSKAVDIEDNVDNNLKLYTAKYNYYKQEMDDIDSRIENFKKKINDVEKMNMDRLYDGYKLKIDELIESNEVEVLNGIKVKIDKDIDLDDKSKSELIKIIDEFEKENSNE